MSESRTPFTAQQLKTARKSLGMSQAECARYLRTPLRTYTGWESGETRIPGVVMVAMELLIKKDRWVMQAITEKLEATLARKYPHGIPSAVEREE